MVKFLKRYDVFFTVFCFAAAMFGQHYEWLSLAEDQTVSFRHQLRLAYGDQQAQAVAKEVVLVNTDEAFFKAYKSFPLRRSDIATIVTNLKELGAKIIAIDMLMDFPSSYNEDPALAKALNDAGNTLLVAQADFRSGHFVRLNRPTNLLDQASESAYTNIGSNSRLVTSLSRLKIHPEIAHQGGWPFAVAAAAMYLGVEPKLEPGLLRLGELSVPLDHDNTLSIDFPPLPAGTHSLSQSIGISASEFLDIASLDASDRAELEYWVKDRIVVVGDTSEVSHDWFDTPVGTVYGVEIIADTISSILKGGPLRAASPEVAAGAAAAMMAVMVALALVVTRPLARVSAVVVATLGFVVGTSVAYVQHGLVLPMAYVLLAVVFSHVLIEFRQYLVERNQKQRLNKTFGQYIPSELVEEMNKSGQDVSVGGESREMTVLFSDVRGFTSISEGLAPQELTVLMNAFLSPMTRVIHEHRGTIDKYMGDAIMAFWGAPLHDPDHARNAVRAAMALGATMERLSTEFVERGWKPLKIGVGLNTGVMNVGNMGSDFRLAYTVLGDAVNLGSRIESLTKQYGVQTMVSEYTHAAVPGLVCRELDLVRVKGKDTPVRLMEPLGFDGEVPTETLVGLERYHAALRLYRAQAWDDAAPEFAALAADDPDRMIYRLYQDRIHHFRTDPPGPDWDGVYTHKEK